MYISRVKFVLFLVPFFILQVIFGADSFNESPYNTVYSHIHYLQSDEYNPEIAAKAFHISDKQEAIELAIELKQVLDGKGIFIQLNKVPQDPDYIDSVTRTNKYILNEKLPVVYLEKTGDNWYYSDITVHAIPGLYKEVFPFGAAFWVKWFPYKSNKLIMGFHPWQWAGASILLGSFIILFFLFRVLFLFFIRKIVERKIKGPFDDPPLLKLLANILSLLLALYVVKIFIPTLLLSNKLSAALIKGVEVVSAVLLIIFLYKGLELAIKFAQVVASKTASQWDDQFLLVIRRLSKLGILLFGVFYVLNVLDVNITTVIAGISIGGLAFALAAQDTVKNFIGSLMIFFDRPFQISDLIKGDNFEGTVLEIGFRSTRIKTVDDSLVTVPNGYLANMTIENKGKRLIRRFKAELGISHEVTQWALEHFIKGIRTIVNKHPNTQNGTLNVYISSITSKAIVVSVNYKYAVLTNTDEFSHRQYIYKNILELAAILHINLSEKPDNLQDALKGKADTEQTGSAEQIEKKLDLFYDQLEAHMNPE